MIEPAPSRATTPRRFSSHRSPRTRRIPGPSRGLALVALAAAGLGTAACDRGDILEILGEVRPGEGGGPGAERIPFQVFRDDVGDRAATERRVLLKSPEAYQTFFGHPAPAGVDLGKEWVIFYAAGRRPNGGFEANVRSLARVGASLQAVTQLVSPGRGCAVTDAITTPHVLIKFAAQPSTTSIEFTRADRVKDCEGGLENPCAATLCPVDHECVVLESYPPQAKCVPIPPKPDVCAGVRCPGGTRCVAQPVTCVRAPCPPVAQCVPAGPRCGGFAGIPCPGSGSCQDDPSDSCDPNRGGADCGGICACNVIADCATGSVWDGSPGVCACVPSKPEPPTCGKNTCGAGEYCCNASCGICAPKGGACIQIACN